MDYYKFGNGDKTFVILPGISIKSVLESKEAVADAYKAFGDDYTCYLVDYQNEVRLGYAVKDFADDIALMLLEMGIHDVYVFGASLGGMIAQELALRHRELVKKIVCGSTMAHHSDETKALFSYWYTLCKNRDTATLNKDMREHIYSDASLEMFASFFASVENDATDYELDRMALLLKSMDYFDIRKSLKDIKCPMLVIGATGDKALPYSMTEEIIRLAECEGYIYEGYSHAVYDEAPDYKDRILEFFNK